MEEHVRGFPLSGAHETGLSICEFKDCSFSPDRGRSSGAGVQAMTSAHLGCISVKVANLHKPKIVLIKPNES
jgi:hypothetical protein